jgi:uncharacterized protein YaaN involved in tellurite resistance
MIKKGNFIAKIVYKISRDLEKILPDEHTLDEMYDKLKEYLNQEFKGI